MKNVVPWFTIGIAHLIGLVSLTAQDMPLSQVLMEDEPWKLVAEGFRSLDGAAVDQQGNLFFTDAPANRVYKLGTDGRMSIFLEQSGGMKGVAFGPDGLLYGCRESKRQVVSLDPQTGKASVVANGFHSEDLIVTSRGGIYFTDPIHKKIWYVSKGGDPRVVDQGMDRPAGITLTTDRKSLVVADGAGERLWSFSIQSDGSLSYKQPYYDVRTPWNAEASGAEGMTVDEAGRLYVMTTEGLQMFDPTGRLGGVILIPEKGVGSDVVFGGPDRRTLYITSGTRLYQRRTKAKGISWGAN